MSERTGTVARHILNLSDLKRYEEMFKFAIKLENELSAATQQLNEQAAVIEMLREALEESNALNINWSSEALNPIQWCLIEAGRI